MYPPVVLVVLSTLMLVSGGVADSTISLPKQTLPSADAQPKSLDELRGAKGTVVVFLSTQCPISNAYVPTLNALAERYASAGVGFIGVNSNDGQSLREIAQHRRDFQLAMPVLKDAGAGLAKAVGATHCPEVCVFDSVGVLCYRGRIDDRFSRRGGSAKEVGEHDLQDAIAAVVAGTTVAVERTIAVGCPISMPSAMTKFANDAPTFSKDIAVILQRHCQECHRPGGIGPFALLEYEQAKSWGEDLVHAVESERMPPWKPVDGFGAFHDRNRLSVDELAKLKAWAAAGAPKGNDADLPAPIAFAEGWRLGTPDLVLEPTEEYVVAPAGNDEYRCFVFPTNLSDDVYVTAAEVMPGNASVVHHVLLFVDGKGESVKLDERDPGPGYRTKAGPPGFTPDSGLGGWAPGNRPRHLPDGMARVLTKGSYLVMQVHYHPTGKSEADRTKIGLHFAKGEVTRSVRALPFLPLSLWHRMRIPADDPNFEVKASLTLPGDMVAVGITPHMHLIGRDMKVTATLPDGKVVPLIYIKDWDFRWQGTYRYLEPIDLPAGTKLNMVAHFDNSADNPANPSRPPKLVKWGEQTTDEMCIAFIELTPKKPATSPEELRGPARGKFLADIIRHQLSEQVGWQWKGAAKNSE